jgi:hypothetical protein
MNPISDPDVLRRLSALYRYALGLSDVPRSAFTDPDPSKANKSYAAHVEAQFMCEYPIPQESASDSGSPATTTVTETKSSFLESSSTTTTKSGGDQSPTKTGSVTLILRCLTSGAKTYIERPIKVSRSSLTLPDCVICVNDEPVSPNYDPKKVGDDGKPVPLAWYADAGAFDVDDVLHATINPSSPSRPFINKSLRFGFISKDRAGCGSPTADDSSNRDPCILGSYSFHKFYWHDNKELWPANAENRPKLALHEFELLLTSATAVGSSAASSSSNGSNGAKQKMLVLPVGPNNSILQQIQ